MICARACSLTRARCGEGELRADLWSACGLEARTFDCFKSADNQTFSLLSPNKKALDTRVRPAHYRQQQINKTCGRVRYG